MTGSLNKFSSLVAAILAVGLSGPIAAETAADEGGVAPPLARAQSEEDAADGSEEATGAPIGLIGGGFAAPKEEKKESGLESLRAAPGAENAVEVGSLDMLDSVILGLVDESQGGFAADLWTGSKRKTVATYLPQIPARTPSQAMRDLTYRLLASKSLAPEGEVDGVSILSLRLEGLYKGGFIEAADDLSRQDLTPGGDPDVMMVSAKVALLGGDAQTACAQAARSRGLSDSNQWLKIRAYCYAVTGDQASARLSANLLREDGYEDPVFFGLLLTALDQLPAEVDDYGEADELTLALLRLAEVGLPSEAMGGASLPVQLEIARTGMAGGAAADLMTARLPVAEAAARGGALEPRKLAILYRNVPFLQSEVMGLVEKIYEDPSPEARAALFQYVEAQEVPQARASQIKKALDVGRLSGTYQVAMSIYGPMIGEFEVGPAFAPYAGDFVPALYAINHYAQGEAWLDLALAQEMQAVANGAPRSQRLQTFDTCRQIRNLPGQDTLVTWDPVGRLASAKDDASFSLAVHEMRLMEILGVAVPMEARQLIIARPLDVEGQMPPTGVLSGLEAASRSGRLGETVMFALVALGPEGPQGAPTPVVERVVAALARVGLYTEAQAVAIESLIARAS
ncbi:MAG: hypothetical protein EP347_03095 [Alphaproteobacteria bacterium]|nr:MAG: hypothetical protein EP347_03095 [Alphaproteobacteria bacterium]